MGKKEYVVMKIDEYFDCLAQDDIRIKGTRIGIESVLYEFIYREQSPDSIVKRFPTLTLEQVYATILYYLHDKERFNAYMKDWLTFSESARATQKENPPPVIQRLHELKKKQNKAAIL
jgi:uncharacterized protein (DUF433 family)